MSLMNRLPWRREREERTESREEPTSIDLFRDMNRMFDEFFTRGFGLSPLWSEEGWASFSPSIDVVETDDAIRVSAELPGLEEKDIELRLDNNMLTIRGEKKHEHEERDAHTTVPSGPTAPSSAPWRSPLRSRPRMQRPSIATAY